jgi:NAD(P)H-dependent flavin oxidoreductase YrpB (nitropropane dioxygenase family)
MAEQRSSHFLNARSRATAFCERYGLQVPILQAPMAGSCPAGLAAVGANAGGLGGMGALMTSPEGIAEWVAEFRSQSNGPFQLNRWIPQPTPGLRSGEDEVVPCPSSQRVYRYIGEFVEEQRQRDRSLF